MSEKEAKVYLNLTFRAALIVTAIGLGLFGVLDFNHVECKVCWKDVTRYYFLIYGYISGFGFAIGCTLPVKSKCADDARHSWHTREGFWVGSLGLGALAAVGSAVMHLIS